MFDGPMAGWRYTATGFALIEGAECVFCIVTPPHWPFPHPKPVMFQAGKVTLFMPVATDIPHPQLLYPAQHFKAAEEVKKKLKRD